ncbi:hypothetical protein [uncultured Nostoc sp.]|uniref:hypothetical protein n=1 Tax=uncultured Nostoc sp. TaxID=340711 RepID=UPI0035CB17C8
MESMLFTTLTAYEEATLSGGNKPAPKKDKDSKPKKYDKKYDKYGKLVYAPVNIDLNVITQVLIQKGKDNVGVQEATIKTA